MEVILIFIVGFIVLIIALFSVIKMITNRVQAPTENLREDMISLEERVAKLESKTNK